MNLKNLFIAILSLYSCASASAENKFYIEDFSINAGETKEIEILLTNDVAFTGFEADIYIPEGLTVFQEDGMYIFDLSDRKYRNHIIDAAKQDDGAIKLLSYTTSSKDYSGNSGALVYFTVTADSNFSGIHQIEIKNIIFTQADGTQYNFDPTTTTVTGPTPGSDEYPMTIKDCESGSVSIFVTSGNSAKLKFEAVQNWIVNNVTVNGVDVTAELDSEGVYTTAPIAEPTTIIVTYKDKNSDVETLSNKNINVIGYNGCVEINGVNCGDYIAIYDIDGALIYSTIADNETVTVNLPKDIVYIVKCQQNVFKLKL